MIPQPTIEGDSPDIPPVPEVDSEEAFDGDVTLYLRSSAPDVARDRQRAALERMKGLRAADAIETLETVQWPNKVSEPADGPDSETVACYDEFADTVGERSLEPFFEQRPGVGRLERVIVLPVICIAARREGELVGVYPRWNDGTHESVEDGIRSLAAGDVRNI